LTLDEFQPNLHGTLVRNANSIDIASRTLLVEAMLTIRPASFCRALTFLSISSCPTTRSVTIPSNTLIFRKEGLQVGLFAMASDLFRSRSAATMESVEIVSGLQPTDAVIVDPSDSLVAGTPVR